MVGHAFNHSRPYGSRIERKGKRIFISHLETYDDLAELYTYIRWILHNPQTYEVVLYFKEKFRPFPNIIAALAATIELLRHQGKKVSVKNEIEELSATHFDSPLSANESNDKVLPNPAGIVWRYSDSAQVERLLTHTIDYLSRNLECEAGILPAIEWSLNEILDNVFQHSTVGHGYFMFQLQSDKRRLSYCVSDHGRGIYQSFRGSRYKPASPADAITLAIQQGVTRDNEIGMGNGLWGSSEIIALNRGRMTITSGGAAIFFNRETGMVRPIENVATVQADSPGTSIDVQIDAANSVNLKEALGDYGAPVSLCMERLENSDGFLVVQIKKISIGTGTREAGKLMLLYVSNLMRNSPQPLLLDFSNVGIVSSSYADEFIGKLYRNMTTEVAASRLRFAGLCEAVQLVIRNAIAQRARP